MKKTCALISACAIATSCIAVPFQNLKLDQEVNTSGLDVVNTSISSTNGTVIIGGTPEQNSSIQQVNGITFEVKEDGELRFIFQSDVMGQPIGNPMNRITINGVSLLRIIDDRIQEKIQQAGGISPSSITNQIRGMVYNPLWGKKLAVIGDSLTCTPKVEQSYPYFIAQRNNMTLVHNGRSGERLCVNVTNSLGEITNPSTISSYTNDIPADADFILCQIGANDVTGWWRRDSAKATPVPDTDMSTDTFKGCWNNLLIGLKTHYPNAKIGMILANNWTNNLGQKSEDTIPSGEKREMTQWQKIQCQKLNIPVFDPQEDSRQLAFLYKEYVPTNGTTITESSISDSVLDWYDRTKREIGTDHSWYKSTSNGWMFQTQYMRDWQHMTKEGNLLMSFFYENWMKTVLMAN